METIQKINVEKMIQTDIANLELFFEFSLDGAILCDETGLIIKWNKSQEIISGIPAKEVLGKPIWDLQCQSLSEAKNSPEKNEENKILYTRALKTGKASWFGKLLETEILHPDGKRRIVQTHSFPIHTLNGYMIGSINRDITDSKKTSDQIVNNNEEPGNHIHEDTDHLADIMLQLEAEISHREKTQNDLYRSEEMLRVILDNIPQRIFWKDKNSHYLGCNKAFARDKGYESPKEIMGKNDFDLTFWENAAWNQAEEQSILKTGKPKFNYEEERLKPDGGTQWLRTDKLPLKDRQGDVIGILGTYEDISEQKQAEKVQNITLQISQAAQNSDNLDNLYLSIHAILGGLMPVDNFYIALYDARQDILSFPYFVDQYDEAPLPRKSANGLTEYVLRTCKPLLVTSEVFKQLLSEGEVDLVGSDSLDWMGVPLKNGKQPIGIMVIQTYTENLRFNQKQLAILDFVSTQIGMAIQRKRAEEEIKNQHDFLRKVVDVNPNIIVVKDSQGHFTLANQATAKMYGSTVDNLMGRMDSDFNKNHSEVEWFQNSDSEVIRSGKEKLILEEPITDASGKVHFLQTIKSPLFGPDGKANSLLIVATDITERLQREKELEAVARVSAALRGATNRLEMPPIIVNELNDILKPDGSVLATIDLKGKEFVLEFGIGVLAEYNGVKFPSGDGITSVVLNERKPYVNRDILQDGKFLFPDLLKEIYAVCSVPLYTQDKNIGVIWIARRKEFDEYEVRLLTAIADIAANALNRAALHEKTRQKLEQVNALHEIDIAIGSNRKLQPVLEIILNQVMRELKVDATDILVLSPLKRTYDFAAGLGFRTHFIEHSHVKKGEGVTGLAVLEKRPISVEDINQEPNFTRALLFVNEEFVSYHCIPLIVDKEVTGILEVFNRSTLNVDTDWLDFFEILAGQAAIAIDNALLFENLQRSNSEITWAYDATIEGWSHALELRDRETQGHTLRVVELTLNIATEMGMSKSDLTQIRRGALLHDIGKMGIPDGILLKPGSLTESEWEVMREHPVLAYNMLSPILFLRQALDIPYCHHEKWDGTGYPRQLKEKNIPLSARIFAVADVWDALCSDRPYRKAWSEEQALSYICEQSGKQFDPDVVNAFLKIKKVEENLNIKTR
jgi:PAS domain S-box-containing protein/putative nucleotidyltransferase with HDIG domain